MSVLQSIDAFRLTPSFLVCSDVNNLLGVRFLLKLVDTLSCHALPKVCVLKLGIVSFSSKAEHFYIKREHIH